jgi:hypothetical protein
MSVLASETASATAGREGKATSLDKLSRRSLAEVD